MEMVTIKLLNERGLTTIQKVLDVEDFDMLNWVAKQYEEVNNARVTIESWDGNVLTFTGEAPF